MAVVRDELISVCGGLKVQKRRFCVLFCVIFLVFSATIAFAIPPTYHGPYQVELEDGLVLHMTDNFSENDGDKPSGLYRNEELVYSIESFIPQDNLLHISDNGMHMMVFWRNYRDHWMLASELGRDGSIGTIVVYYMGNVIDRFEVAGLWFSPSGSRWHRVGDDTLHIITTGVLHRRELVMNLSNYAVSSERGHFNVRLIAPAIIIPIAIITVAVLVVKKLKTSRKK